MSDIRQNIENIFNAKNDITTQSLHFYFNMEIK